MVMTVITPRLRVLRSDDCGDDMIITTYGQIINGDVLPWV